MPRPKSPKSMRTKVEIRVTYAEQQNLLAAAYHAELPLSSWIRAAALRAARRRSYTYPVPSKPEAANRTLCPVVLAAMSPENRRMLELANAPAVKSKTT
ncbi:MAG: hypothetical protein ACRD5H_00035 [Nitrososphaerales archaeon]